MPFYLQPTLGGGDDLRGFRPYRFYDDDSLVFTGEYWWQLFTGFDMALFGDAGKVGPRPGDLGFSHFKTDAGFGLRVRTRSSISIASRLADTAKIAVAGHRRKMLPEDLEAFWSGFRAIATGGIAACRVST